MFSISPNESEQFKADILNILDMDADTYNWATDGEIISKLKTKMNEVYDLKQAVIDKFKSTGTVDEGYHTFITNNRYGDTNYSYAKYIKIGDNGFHYDNTRYEPTNLTSLGEISGTIQADKSIKYDTKIINRLRRFVENR